MKNRKVRIGLIGAGGVVKDLHLPALSNMSNITIRWICDKDGLRASQLAQLFKIPETYCDLDQCTDVDIVLVAIPVGYRHLVMDRIFERGWHAFCEKPFAVSFEEYGQFLNAARAKDIQVGIALVRRYAPATVLAGKLVRLNHFGPIVKVWADEGLRTKRTGREANFYMFDPKVSGGGVLMETGSHLVDQLCTILDIKGFGFDRCIQKKYHDLEMETIFAGSVSTIHQQDIRCSFAVSKLEDLCNGIFIQYRDFILRCGLGFDSPLELCNLKGESFACLKTEKVSENAAFSLEWNDFIEQCMTGKPSHLDIESARYSMEIIDLCYKQAESINVFENAFEGLKNEKN